MRVTLTRKGDRLVTKLTEAHLAELDNLAAVLNELTAGGHVAPTEVLEPQSV